MSELYVGVIGNDRLQTFPVWEMVFDRMPKEIARIATARVKWNVKYQKKHGIDTGPALDLSPEKEKQIQRLCKRVYRVLHMSGYGRIDLRMNANGDVYVIEANSNPNLEFGEDLAESAHLGGVSYDKLVQKILSLGLSYVAPWAE